MKRITLILILFLFLTGCEKEVSSLQDRNGIKYEINDEVGFTGRLVEKDEDGQKKTEVNYKDGKEDGLVTWWNENRQKKEEANYKTGWLDGLWTRWYENGQKWREVNHKDGKREGLLIEWDENGEILSALTYISGEIVK